MSAKNTKLKTARVVITFFILILLSGTVNAQFFSPANIRNVKVAELSNKDIERIKGEMDKQNISIEAAEGIAVSNGMSAQDFAVLKTRITTLSNQQTQAAIAVDTNLQTKEDVVPLNKTTEQSQIYGSEFFSNTSLSFEPNSSIATPASYVLGPGDELQVVIYGMQEYVNSHTVSKEGFINIPVVGQVYVSGLSFDAAKTRIKTACQKIYPSLTSGASQLSLSLNKIRTINVTIIGAKKPGNYSVSSLSTVFNALHIAGGPTNNGSYRNIELVRNGKVVKVIDLYRFLTSGSQEDNVNLQENDVIRIPGYETRVEIVGSVKRPGIFELLPKESFENLLRYAGGFDAVAYRKIVRVVQRADNGVSTKVIDLTEDHFKNYQPQSGDHFVVDSVTGKYTNKVSVKGYVLRPGDYEFKEGMTVKDLLEKAVGVTQDAYLTRAILIREREDLTKEINYVNLNEVSNGSDNTLLRKNDELIISSLFELNNNKTIKINGQIKKPGEYPFIENIKLYDLIIMAGGFTYGASRTVEVSSMIVRDEPSGKNSKVGEVKTFEIDTLLIDSTNNIALKPFDVVTIRKKPIFEPIHSVTVEGQVEYPGIYAIADKKERLLDLITRTGGLRYEANPCGLRVVRRLEVTQADGGKTIKEVIVPVSYKKILKNPSSRENFALRDGDVLIVPESKRTVGVLGQVQLNSEIPFFSKRLIKYINAAGGFNEEASKEQVYIIKPNGLADATKTILGVHYYPKVTPGSTIIVPAQTTEKKEKMTPTEKAVIASIVSGISSSVVAILSLTKSYW